MPIWTPRSPTSCGARPRGNVAEAARRTGRDRANRYRIALGSAAEVTQKRLDVAVAAGYLEAARAEPALALADRVRAMTFRLSRP